MDLSGILCGKSVSGIFIWLRLLDVGIEHLEQHKTLLKYKKKFDRKKKSPDKLKNCLPGSAPIPLSPLNTELRSGKLPIKSSKVGEKFYVTLADQETVHLLKPCCCFLRKRKTGLVYGVL